MKKRQWGLLITGLSKPYQNLENNKLYYEWIGHFITGTSYVEDLPKKYDSKKIAQDVNNKIMKTSIWTYKVEEIK